MNSTHNNSSFELDLKRLKRNGYVLVSKALDEKTVTQWKSILYGMYHRNEYEIDNSVGNVAFEKLLAGQPERSQQLINHPRTGVFLKAILGKQCQLRSLRAHINPRAYTQEWHMDFRDYYFQEDQSEAEQPLKGLCMNVTFYLTDNTPDRGRLTFLPQFMQQPIPESVRPHDYYTDDRSNPFQAWCDEQEQEHLYPLAGDAVVFYSHIPHQGAKKGEDPADDMRANIVLHFQQNPMYPGIRFVSTPDFTLQTLGYAGTFPFADEP